MPIKPKQPKRKVNPYAGLFIFTDPVRNRKYMKKEEANVAKSIKKLEKEEPVNIYRLKEQRLRLEAIQTALKKKDEKY